MPAAYRITGSPDGLFNIERDEAAGPTQDQEQLARTLDVVLRKIRSDLAAGKILPPEAALQLRGIAERGLTAEPPAPAEALAELSRLYPQPGEPEQQRRRPSGAYEVIFDARTGHITINRARGGPEPSEAQRGFFAHLMRQEQHIDSLYRKHGTQTAFIEAKRRLAFAAAIALRDVPPDVRLAELAVEAIVMDASREMGRLARASYLSTLAHTYIQAVVGTGVAIFLYWLLTNGGPHGIPVPVSVIIPGERLVLLFVALSSVMAGAWLTAAVRLQPDSVEILDSIFTNTFTAWLRAIFVLGFGVMALLLLYKQIIVFSFGVAPSVYGSQPPFTTAMVLQKLSSAILTGAFLGLGEAALPNAVIQRSAGLVAAIAASPERR